MEGYIEKKLAPLAPLAPNRVQRVQGVQPFFLFRLPNVCMRETNRSVAFGEKSTKSFKSFNYSHLFDLSDL